MSDAEVLDPHGPLSISVTTEGDEAVIQLAGELDAHSSEQLERTVEQLAGQGRRRVVIDLGQVGFIDSSGLRVLLSSRARLGDTDDAVALRNPSASTQRLLEITGLTDYFGSR